MVGGAARRRRRSPVLRARRARRSRTREVESSGDPGGKSGGRSVGRAHNRETQMVGFQILLLTQLQYICILFKTYTITDTTYINKETRKEFQKSETKENV